MQKLQWLIPAVGIGIVSALIAKTICEAFVIAEPWQTTLSGAFVAVAVVGSLAYCQNRSQHGEAAQESK